jgi:pyruvate-formate lyase
MQTLSERSSELNFLDSSAANNSLSYAKHFTARFREVENLPSVLREAKMLSLQFPACLQPREPGETLAGRIVYPCVGISPEPCGLGWYFDFGGVKRRLSSPDCAETERTEWEALTTFWRARVTQAKCRAAYPEDVVALLPSDQWTEDAGVGFPLYRIAGTLLDFGPLCRLGLDGLEAGLRGGDDFSVAARDVLTIFRRSLRAYGLESLAQRAPQTLAEAIQLIWLWALHAGTWNYGRLDVLLGPFLQEDLANGTLTEETSLNLLCEFWRLIHAYNNQYNNRIIIGGKGRPDEAMADAFALLAIEATRRVRLNQPQLSLRFSRNQNPALWDRAITAIGEGCTYPILYNDDINIPAVAVAHGVTEEIAQGFSPYGCGEYMLGPGSVASPNGVINLLKALEDALGDGEGFTDFEQVWMAYQTVIDRNVEALARQQKIEYEVTAGDCAFLFASILSPGCVEKKKSLLSGGAWHVGGTLETYGNTNTANSLLVLRELVFVQQRCSLPEILRALRANFVGHEELLRACRAVLKYGNDEALADEMASKVHQHICTVTRDQAARVGLDSYLVVIINNWANVVLGRHVGASADGRLAGEAMANANNPTPGSDTRGVSAFLNSLATLDPSIHAGAVQNMKFGKEWFCPNNRPKFEALLRTYFQRGGTQAMITVVSRDDLEAAMREPEKWGHLLVRMGGFSIRFVELPPDAQREVLARTLH